MKILLLIVGAALLVLGLQDGIKLLADSSSTSLFSWLPGEATLYIALDVVLAVAGASLAGYALRIKS